MRPAVLRSIEEIVRIPSGGECDDDHEDRVGERHDDPAEWEQHQMCLAAVLPREAHEQQDGHDGYGAMQENFARHRLVAWRLDEPPVDSADDDGGHGQVAEYW